MAPLTKDTPRSSARKRNQVSYKENEENEEPVSTNDNQQQGKKRKLKALEDETPVKQESAKMLDSGSKTQCLLCASEVEGGLKEARFHYTICLLNEGSFSLLEAYKERGAAGEKIYTCLFSEEGCTKKKYNHRNFCIHMATSHGFDSVAQIMARHPHPGMKLVLQSLFPEHSLVKESPAAKQHLLEVENQDENQVEDNSLDEASVPLKPDPSPAMVVKPMVLTSPGPARRKPGPKPKMKQGVTNTRSASPAKPNQMISTFFSPSRSTAVRPSEEEENVDEPSEPIPVEKPPAIRQRGPASRTGLAAASKSSTRSSTASSTNIKSSTGSIASLSDVQPTSETLSVAQESDAPTDNAKQRELYSLFQRYIPNAPPAPSGDIKEFPEKSHICQICKGQGQAGKEGRCLKRGPVHLSTTMYHYAACFYSERNLAFMIDPGRNNIRQDDGTQDEFGQRFKYKCPFTECEKNTGRKIAQMGFKEYAIHIAVRHYVMESLMAEIKTPEMADILEEVVAVRHARGEQVVEIPEVIVEELHTCLICEGETKEGRDLSFQGIKRAGLRYHYASCLYDTNVYLAKYPPGESNRDKEGQVKDTMGAEMKYQCSSNGCSLSRKRKPMGYKEHCIHMSNEHGGLEEVLLEHSRPEVRAVGAKLLATKQGAK